MERVPFIGGGCSVTSNAKVFGSSRTVIGSTKAPVVKMQCRTAPTPFPSISADVGQATPALNSQSSGGGGSEKETTCSQTVSGGAFTTTSERTANNGASDSTVFSNPIRKKVAMNMARDGFP